MGSAAAVEQFIRENKISAEERKEGVTIANMIFDSIKNRGQFSIARVRLVGSVGRGTALVGADFDLVALVNDEYPPFNRVLQSFKSILECSDLPIENLKKGKHSIQFDIGGTSFDLLPATNFETKYCSQYRGASHHIDKLDDPVKDSYTFSPALCEKAVDFVKNRSDFTKNVIILAKSWNENIANIGYHSGRSHMIELIAIYANKGKRKKSVLQGFLRFLLLMRKFKELRVVFNTYYEEESIPEEVFEETPLVLDPVNPFNNLADGLSNKSVKLFSNAAYKTLYKINRYYFDIDVEKLLES